MEKWPIETDDFPLKLPEKDSHPDHRCPAGDSAGLCATLDQADTGGGVAAGSIERGARGKHWISVLYIY